MSDNKRYWCGIRGVYQIWHGQWADPEVRYRNYICNEWDLQESMYISMKDRIADGEDWGDPDNDEDFMNFCKANADLVKQDIIELSSGGVYENVKTVKSKKINESGSLRRKSYDRDEELIDRLNKEVKELCSYLDDKIDSLNFIAMHSTNPVIGNRARAIINDLVQTTEDAREAYSLIKANRW